MRRYGTAIDTLCPIQVVVNSSTIFNPSLEELTVFVYWWVLPVNLNDFTQNIYMVGDKPLSIWLYALQ